MLGATVVVELVEDVDVVGVVVVVSRVVVVEGGGTVVLVVVVVVDAFTMIEPKEKTFGTKYLERVR